MGVIAILSSDYFASDETESWLGPLFAALLPAGDVALFHGLHGALRKLGHLAEYGILAALWFGALRPGRPSRRAAVWAIALATTYAGIDEARQGLTTHRSAAPLDVLIDATGAVVAVAWLHASERVAIAFTRLGRWAAWLLAGASLGAAAVDWRLDLPAWDLVVAALGAVLVAWGFRRIERHLAEPAAAARRSSR
jgi:hypothetical protein